MMTILLFLRKALQMQSSCFYPAERLLLSMVPSSPFFSMTVW